MHLSSSSTRGPVALAEAGIHQDRMLKLCAMARLRVAAKDVRVFVLEELARTLPAYSALTAHLSVEDELPRLDELSAADKHRVVNEIMQRESPAGETCQVRGAAMCDCRPASLALAITWWR